jgi:hypothetical protein
MMTQLSNKVDDSLCYIAWARFYKRKRRVRKNRIENRRTSTRAFNPDGYCRLTDGQLLCVRRKTKRRRRRNKFPLIPTYLSTQAHAQGIYTQKRQPPPPPPLPRTSHAQIHQQSLRRDRRSVWVFFSGFSLLIGSCCALAQTCTHTDTQHSSSFFFFSCYLFFTVRDEREK